MPQPIMTKYKQGDLGMPYPKKKIIRRNNATTNYDKIQAR